jgi:hypothetical protein
VTTPPRKAKDLPDNLIMELLRGQSALNRARAKFSSWRAKIEQAGQQRTALSPIEMRRMEFEAVEEILEAFNND